MTDLAPDIDFAEVPLEVGKLARIAASLSAVTLDEFADVDEPGADPLVGDGEDALITEDGDVMFYGDGGAGKTTLCIDLACHLAAGDDWLGVTVKRPARVLLVENEGPRPLFRRKLRRKRDGWTGSPLEDRVYVVEAPWARLSFADETCRESLAATIRELDIDVVIVGPVTRSGMDEAGTLQHVRDFMVLVAAVRRLADRRVTFALVHHESKSGQVSGAWEGAGDTLFHVQGQGHGRTRLYVQKARWSSSHHATALHLRWTDGDGFELEEAERDENTIADELLAFVLANGGTSWKRVEAAVAGKGETLRSLRDRLLEGGRLVNAGSDARMQLWHADDPALPAVRVPDGTRLGHAPVSAAGEGGNRDRVPVSLGNRDTGRDTVSSPALDGAE